MQAALPASTPDGEAYGNPRACASGSPSFAFLSPSFAFLSPFFPLKALSKNSCPVVVFLRRMALEVGRSTVHCTPEDWLSGCKTYWVFLQPDNRHGESAPGISKTASVDDVCAWAARDVSEGGAGLSDANVDILRVQEIDGAVL